MKNRMSYLILGVLALPVFLLGLIFHDEPIIFDIGSIMFIAIGITITAFVVIYSQRHWRDYEGGRAVMYANLALAAITYLSLTNLVLGSDWEYRPLARVLLFSAILITQINQLRVLFRSDESREARAKEDDDRVGRRSDS